MKTRDVILVFGSIVALLSFIVLMFDFYVRTQEVQVVKKNLYYDSLILVEQKSLREKDSIILSNQELLKKLIINHSGQIHHINKTVKGLVEVKDKE